jgi:hypothetical protein
MPTPFFYGNPVPSDRFIDRRKEIRRIVGRIVNQGQSTAIVGEPRIGKTCPLPRPLSQKRERGERRHSPFLSRLLGEEGG